jgi:hypothetical protein
MTKDDDDGFLDRWSRRKRGEARRETAPETARPAAAPATPSGGRSGPPPAPAHPLAVTPSSPEESQDSGDPEVVAKLPDLDSLDEDTDFSVFLQDGVPEALRRQALRRLWRLNPVFANLDGLNDYDENYSALGMVAENIKTLYQAGKGYLDDDENETETEATIADGAEGGGEDETGEADSEAAAVTGAETGADGAPDSEPPNPADPVESARVFRGAPASDSGPPAGGNRESNSEKPVPGSALARRWGGSPDKG